MVLCEDVCIPAVPAFLVNSGKYIHKTLANFNFHQTKMPCPPGYFCNVVTCQGKNLGVLRTPLKNHTNFPNSHQKITE